VVKNQMTKKVTAPVPHDLTELTTLIRRIAGLTLDNGVARAELNEREQVIIVGALSALEGMMAAAEVLYTPDLFKNKG
jgi:hypothetical protein